MFWTVLALVLMVVLSGFISYYGDLQGRRWGKRRVSWFGLRPKYTAIIITSLTGAMIALLSIVTVLIAFPTIREVLLNGERAIRENKKTLEENSRLNQSLAVERKVTTRELEKLRASQNELNNQLRIKKLEVELARKDVAEAQQKLTPLQAELTTLQSKQTNLEATLKQEQAAIKQKSLELQATIADNKRASEANAGLVQQNQELQQQKQRLAKMNRDLEEGNKDLQREKETLTHNVAKLSEDRMRITHENNALLEVNKTLLSQNSDLEAKLRTGSAELERTQRELNRANSQLTDAISSLAGTSQSFTQSYHALRQGEINIRAGAELARGVIAGKQSSEAVRKQLVQLLGESSDSAIVHGATRGENNRAVRIVSKKLVSQFETKNADEAASINALSDVIANSQTPVVVVATSLNNSLSGEQVIIELRSFPVSRVFDKGEVVAARVIDADQPAKRVLEAIAEFLQQNVKNAAVRAGSIPRVNPETGRKEVGVYDSIALGQLADRVKRMGGHVLLKAIASENITTADPLDDEHLRFEITRSPQG